MRFLSVVLFAGCSSSDSGTVTDDAPTDGDSTPTTRDTVAPGDTGDTGGDTVPTGDTGPTGGPPTLLTVACAATANALRFECAVDVEPAQAVALTFVRADGLSATRTVSSDDAVGEHVLPLYFMAPEQDYDVTAYATAWPADAVATSVTTGSLPASLASSLAMTGTSTMGMIGSHFPCSSDAVAVVYDTTTGDLLWYEGMDPGGTFGSLDMVQFTEDFTVLGESTGDVIEVDLMGADVVRLLDLDDAFGVTAGGLFGNFHHDIFKRDGVYYVFYQEEYGSGFNPDILDVVVLFDGTGAELARWQPLDHLALPGDWGGDFLHTNTIFVDEAGDILLSWLSQDTVAKIEGDWTTADFGTPLWMLEGGTGDLVGTVTTDWSAVPAPAAFDGQHSLTIRPDGRLMLLDNDNGRGLVIALDEATGTATVDAAYDTRESRCGPQGTARSTLGGNAVVGCMGDFVREYDAASGAMIWEAEVQCSSGGGGGFDEGSARWYPLDGW